MLFCLASTLTFKSLAFLKSRPLSMPQLNLISSCLATNFITLLSHSAAGGVGIYVKANLPANKRDDLSISTVDFETVWIEIDNPKAKNILCCCAYRHPSSDIAKFTDHLQKTLSIANDENKLIHVMGDFNIDLLNHGNHSPHK